MAVHDSGERWWSRQLERIDRALPRNLPDALGFLLEAVGTIGLSFIGITGLSGLVWIIPVLNFVGLDTRGISGFYVWLGTIFACVGLLICGNHIRRVASR